MDVFDVLRMIEACDDSIEWVQELGENVTIREAWGKCERADWLLFALEADSDARIIFFDALLSLSTLKGSASLVAYISQCKKAFEWNNLVPKPDTAPGFEAAYYWPKKLYKYVYMVATRTMRPSEVVYNMTRIIGSRRGTLASYAVSSETEIEICDYIRSKTDVMRIVVKYLRRKQCRN